jgi:hypothetical protein
MPATPSDRPGGRNALERLVLITILAIVVAGIAVPATTKVGLPAEVAQPTTTPSVDGRPPPALSRRADTVKTTPFQPASAPPRRVSPTLPRTRTAAVEPRRTEPAGPPPAQAGAAQAVGATPNGGYVLPGGHFRVTGDARTILDFELLSRCAGSIALPPIPVDATGAFDFGGYPPGAPAETIARVAGRFVSSREARGTAKISRGGCRGETVSFIARLS